MPDDRLIAKRSGHGRRVQRLGHLEYRVWVAYELSADDFGVMRLSALTLQADHDALAREPAECVLAALRAVIDAGLLVAFEDQDEAFVAQRDWQDYQWVSFPRSTALPKPPDAVLATCTEPTQALFDYHPGGQGAPLAKRSCFDVKGRRKDSQRTSEVVPKPSESSLDASRARMAKAKANGSGGCGGDEPDDGGRMEAFYEHWRSALFEIRKATARLTPTPGEQQHMVALLTRYPNDGWLSTITDAYLRTEDREIRRLGVSLGALDHWAAEIESALRADGKRPAGEAA